MTLRLGGLEFECMRGGVLLQEHLRRLGSFAFRSPAAFLCGEGERIAAAIAHLSDDETVAKMGHPIALARRLHKVGS